MSFSCIECKVHKLFRTQKMGQSKCNSIMKPSKKIMASSSNKNRHKILNFLLISALYPSEHQPGWTTDRSPAGHLTLYLHPRDDGDTNCWTHTHQPCHQWSHICYSNLYHRWLHFMVLFLKGESYDLLFLF